MTLVSDAMPTHATSTTSYDRAERGASPGMILDGFIGVACLFSASALGVVYPTVKAALVEWTGLDAWPVAGLLSILVGIQLVAGVRLIRRARARRPWGRRH